MITVLPDLTQTNTCSHTKVLTLKKRLLHLLEHSKFSLNTLKIFELATPGENIFLFGLGKYESEKRLNSDTEKIFQIARIAAIFRIQDILIFHDPFLIPSRARREGRIIKKKPTSL